MSRYQSFEVRFWSKVDKASDPNGCWLWTASTATGYGQFWNGERKVVAHRVAYEMLVGPIPDGLVLDHLCRVRNCVNPAHMEPVSFAENIRRGVAGKAGGERMSAKTRCPRGHEYAGANLYIGTDGSRRCRECDRLRCLRRDRRPKQGPVFAAAAPSTPAPNEETTSGRVVDLMGALEASVAKARDARRAAAPSTPAPETQP